MFVTHTQRFLRAFGMGFRAWASSLSRVLAAVLAVQASTCLAGERWYVAVEGDDAADGRTPATAFASVQRGVDALNPGDTLTILPGEYFGAVMRADVGSAEAQTAIRAAIPGTVLLRGDVPAPAFERVDGTRHVHVAAFAGDVQSVHDFNLYATFDPAPNAAELEVQSGAWHYDASAERLYISTPGFQPPDGRTYTVAVTPASGLHLVRPVRVSVEGLAFTGFNLNHEKDHRDQHGAVWGLWLEHPTRCVVRHCTAFLNAGGIGIRSFPEGGDNGVEHCRVYGNGFAFSGLGGIAIYDANDDVIRDSVAFQRGSAFRFYGGGAGTALLERNLAAQGDTQIKGGVLREVGRMRDSIALGVAETYFNTGSIVAGGNRHKSQAELTDTIDFNDEVDLDPDREFVDPLNYDFRLQSTSRFRGAGSDGGDRGPFPFRRNVFFVHPEGDDGAEGLAMETAWRTLDRALSALRPGDTLYLAGGDHAAPDALDALRGTAERPIAVRGRGTARVTLAGPFAPRDAAHVTFERLHFADPVHVRESDHIAFRNCVFEGGGESAAMTVSRTSAPRVEHNLFAAHANVPALRLADSPAAHLAGNLFGDAGAVAVEIDALSNLTYSDYNNYPPGVGWHVADRRIAPAALSPHERRHQRRMPDFDLADGRLVLANPERFLVGGPLGTALGPHRYDREIPVRVAPPRVHAVSATTANIDWVSNVAAHFEVAWGAPDGSEQTERIPVCRFGAFSLTGLEPGQTYTFRMVSGRTAHPRQSGIEAEPIGLADAAHPLTFTTLEQDRPPRVLHVAPTGDNRNDGLTHETAFRTLNHAAARVGPGDTVRVAPGTYPEQVRVRATGTADAPIRFEGVEGERVVITGGDKELRTVFVLLFKHHVQVDHFYFASLNSTGPYWPGVRTTGAFTVFGSRGVRVTRCLYDGRGGYSPPFLGAAQSPDLLLRNTVMLSPMGGACQITWSSHGFRYEHNILLRPMIAGLWIGSDAQVRNSYFSDNMPSKAFFPLIRFDSGRAVEDNNAFSLRTPDRNPISFNRGVRVEPDEADWTPRPLLRATANFKVLDPYREQVARFLDSDRGGPRVPEDYLMLGAMHDLELTFESFIPTHPEVRRRGIGLQPEAFPWLDFN